MARLAHPTRDGFKYPIPRDVVDWWKRHGGGRWMGASVPDRVYYLPEQRLDHGEYYYAMQFHDRGVRVIFSRDVVELHMGGPTVSAAAQLRMDRAG